MDDLIFVQVSDKMASPDNFMRAYYEQVYARTPGFHMPTHWMEVPTWIPFLSGKLRSHPQRLYVAEHRWKAWANLMSARVDSTVFLGSVMDVNKHIYKDLVGATEDHTWVLGGYVDPEYFKDCPNVRWLDDIWGLETYFPDTFNWAEPPDYRLFGDTFHIPRLAMSEGCLHDCTFCTIPRSITKYTPDEIFEQVYGWQDTYFEYVYVSDKTYGQAGNWRTLEKVGEYLKSHKGDDFKGFIVQTTVPYALSKAVFWYDFEYVRYIEVGVEMPDDNFLTRMQKPYRMAELYDLTAMVRDMKHMGKDIGFIPNLIFGWPEANGLDYAVMHQWVYKNLDIITHINPYILCDYHDSKGNEEGAPIHNGDANENTFDKSWLSEEGRDLAWQAMTEIFGLLGVDIKPEDYTTH